jgi:hypothetical protein
MLADVAYQEYPVMAVQAMNELVHLFGARQTRFIQDVEALLPVVVLIAACQAPLQGARLDAGLTQYVGRAGRGREALDFVAFALGGFTDGS